MISVVFVYTIDYQHRGTTRGLKIASAFIGALFDLSPVTRARTTELRVERIDLDETAQRFITEATRDTLCIIANQPDNRDTLEYRLKEREQREDNLIPTGAPVLFLEVYVEDASEFSDVLKVCGINVGGHRVLRADSTAVPNAIAAFLLYLRDTTGKIPHAYFDWTEGNPFTYLLKYIVFGEGYTARSARNSPSGRARPETRPVVHVSE